MTAFAKAEPATVRRDQQSEPGSSPFIAQNNRVRKRSVKPWSRMREIGQCDQSAPEARQVRRLTVTLSQSSFPRRACPRESGGGDPACAPAPLSRGRALRGHDSMGRGPCVTGYQAAAGHLRPPTDRVLPHVQICRRMRSLWHIITLPSGAMRLPGLPRSRGILSISKPAPAAPLGAR